MKKASSILLLISAIVGLLMSFLGVVFFLIRDGLVDTIYQMGSSVYPQNVAADISSSIANFLIVSAIEMVVGGTLGFIMSAIGWAKLDRANSVSSIKGIAIAVLITGIFSSVVQIVAGILMLRIKEEQLR